MSTSDSQPFDLSLSGINPYHLIICLSDKETTFDIYEHADKKLVASKNIGTVHNLSHNEIISVFNDVIESKLLYQSVRIVFESNIYTLIPNDLFRKDNIQDFLKFQFDIPTSSVIQFSLLAPLEAVNIYALPVELELAMSTLYPKLNIEHHLSYFITDRFKIHASNMATILIRDKAFEILLLASGKPMLLNTFSINSAEDLVYYVLKTFEQFSLDVDKVPLHVFQSKTNSTYAKLLNHYVKNITCE
jgi:hypothetical protein